MFFFLFYFFNFYGRINKWFKIEENETEKKRKLEVDKDKNKSMKIEGEKSKANLESFINIINCLPFFAI